MKVKYIAEAFGFALAGAVIASIVVVLANIGVRPRQPIVLWPTALGVFIGAFLISLFKQIGEHKG